MFKFLKVVAYEVQPGEIAVEYRVQNSFNRKRYTLNQRAYDKLIAQDLVVTPV